MIETIVLELLEIVGDGIQWKDDLGSLTGLIMRLVQSQHELKGRGKTKKRIVEMVCTELIDKNFFNDEQEQIVKNFILEFLPLTIDMLKGLARSIAEVKFPTKCCW